MGVNFYNYQTLYSARRAISPEMPGTAVEFYRKQLERLTYQVLASGIRSRDAVTSIAYLQTIVELDWVASNRPYYKVFPALIPYFLRTKLNVPSEFVGTPFKSILIRLPENHGVPELTITPEYAVRSILVSVDEDDMIIKQGLGIIESDSKFKQLCLFVDIGEHEPVGFVDPRGVTRFLPSRTYQQLLFENPSDTVEFALERLNQRCAKIYQEKRIADGGVEVPFSVTDACLRIAVAVAFLSTGGDKIVEHDVLAKDLRKFIKAKKANDQATIKKLVDRANRNHNHGYTIGRELLFPATYGAGGSKESESTDRELKYQHQRGAHWHWVRYGPGKAKMTLKFFRQTTVRPDLPPNPDARRGYRTPKSLDG